MSFTLRYEVIGLQQIQAKLAQAPDAMRRILRKALQEMAQVTKDEAQHLVPVDTGFLRSSIFYRTNAELEMVIGASAPYAGFVEYGTRYMRAQPFMRPALQNTRQQYMFLLIREVREYLRSLA